MNYTPIDPNEVIRSWSWRAKKIGMTGGELARKCGVTSNSFSLYVNGKTTPSLERFYKIENFLKSRGA